MTITDHGTTIDPEARVSRGGIAEVATKTDQIGDTASVTATATATATKPSLIEEMETGTVTNARKGIDQNQRRASGGSDTKKSVGMKKKTETITDEEVPTEAIGISLPRLVVEETTTAMSLLLRRLKSPRRSRQRRIPRNRQPGHPRHLSSVAKR